MILPNNFSAPTPRKDESFFCSKLVAAAHIAMGLLPEKPAAQNYFPVDYSSDRVLNWQKNIKLDQEYLIDFLL